MSVALLLNVSDSLESLVCWAALIARARNEDLLILQPVKNSGEPKTIDVTADDENRSPLIEATENAVGHDFTWLSAAEDEANTTETAASTTRRVRVRALHHADALRSVIHEIATSSVSLLILPRHRTVKSSSQEFDLERQLLREATCEIMQLRLGDGDAATCRSILVPAGPGQHTTSALQLAHQLATATDGDVTALYVEPDVDEVALQVGQRIVTRVVRRAFASLPDRVTSKVVLDSDVVRGIDGVQQDFELLILGVRYRGAVHRFLFPSISERLISSPGGPTVAVLRPAIPLASRLFRWTEQSLRHGIPQLDRNRRVELVERVHGSSQWDFDFIALICLSTLIATLGLMLGSPAVVIGAMLVAPLMTPLLGAGLSLVQGNVVLLGNAVNAVFRGFLLALAIAFFVGTLTANLTLTSEMQARGSPGLIDLLIAFTSGVAAAYAIGRPNLLSALPGVAIAASLVPPIATCGLALVLRRYNLAIGAGLLFLTNIVAIVLGAACALFAVGIRGSHAHGSFARWTWRVASALVLLTIGLGVYEVWLSKELPNHVHAALVDRLRAADAEPIAVTVDKDQDPVQIEMVINAPRVPDQDLARDLLQILREQYQPHVQLQLRSQLVTHMEAGP